MTGLKWWCAGLMIVMVGTGCTVDNTDSDSAQTEVVDQATNGETPGPQTPTNTPPPESPAPPIATDGRDQLDISGAILLGPHAGSPVKGVPITRNLYATSISGGLVYYTQDDLGWPNVNSPVSGVNARSYIFWVEGSQVYGGHFDWLRPGQEAKTLNNVYAGYLGRRPTKGQPVWFANVRVNGTERTNVANCQNPWP